MNLPEDLLLTSLHLKYQSLFREKQNEVRKKGSSCKQADIKPYGSASCVPFNALIQTSFVKMSINSRAKGEYVLLQNLIPSNVVNGGLLTAVQDSEGAVLPLYLEYFSSPDFSNSASEEPIPKGSFFALKEPLIEFQEQVSLYLLSVTSPTDIVMIRESSQLYKSVQSMHWWHPVASSKIKSEENTAASWKELGNKLHRENKFSSSLEAYLVALNRIEHQDVTLKMTLYSNIAQTYFKLGYYELSLEYNDKVLNFDARNVKALYRAGCAQYKLRQFDLAKEQFEHLLKVDAKNRDGKIELKRCEDRLQETNESIIKQLHSVGWENPKCEIDCRDYVGQVEIKDIPGKGKGVVAKEAVKPGTLLIISKAVATHFYDQPAAVNNDGNPIEKLSIKVANKILKNPKTIGKPVCNLKDCVQLFCDEENQRETIMDLQHIYEIVESRNYGIKFLAHDMFMGKNLLAGHGLFMFPSYFNHSCNPNSRMEIYCDVCVVFSLRTIDKGEEVTISYVNGMERFHERKKRLTLWKFECACDMCTRDRLEPFCVYQKRTDLLLQIRNLLVTQVQIDVSDLEKIFTKLEEAYGESKCIELKTDLLSPYLRLAISHNQVKAYKNQGEAIDRALRSVGLKRSDLLAMAKGIQSVEVNVPGEIEIFVALGLLKNFYKNCSPDGESKFKLCEEALRNLERVFSGGDERKLNARLYSIRFLK